MLTRWAMGALALTCGLLVVFVVGTARAAPLSVEQVDNPRSSHAGWVTDAAQVLGPRAAEIEARLAKLHHDTGAEVALVTLPSIGDRSPKEFATDLFKHWKIGRAGQDDGLLVLHVIDQRRLEIETGYGSEGVLPDAKCAWLINDVAIPRFRAGDLAGGHAALVQGVDYAIRHPGIGHDALVAAANGGPAASAPDAGEHGEKPAADGGFLRNLAQSMNAPLLVTLVLALLVWPLRSSAHRALYPEPKRRPSAPWGGLVFGIVCALALVLLAALLGEVALSHVGSACLALTSALVGRAALRDKRKAVLRFTPRVCDRCQQQMSLIRDGKDEAYLPAGQQVEERIGAVDYDVWKCACGAVKIEEQASTGKASKCPTCGFRTERMKRDKIVRAPTVSNEGLAERHFLCANCNAQRTERVNLPRKRPPSSSSSGSSGSSRGGSGRSGSSFGGGRSGGGGAGGSY